MQYHRDNNVNYEWQSSWCGDDKLLMRMLQDDLTHTARLDQPLVDEEAPVSYLHRDKMIHYAS